MFLLSLFALVAALPAPIAEDASSSVRIFAQASSGVRAVCSGAVVALAEGPRVVSAGHCVEPELEAPFFAEDLNGNRYLLRLERSAYEWPTKDYAVFRSVAAYVLPALPVAETVEVGDRAYVFTAPLGLKMFYSEGYVSGQLFDSPGGAIDGMWLVSLNSDGGSSGSIIINAKGEALGILVGGFSPQIKLDGAIMAPLPD